MMPSGPMPLICDRCAVEVHPGRGDHYVVTIDAVADPHPPVFTAEDLQRDVGPEIDRLIARLSGLTEREAMDQVHRRVVLHLCMPCYTRWIEHPTGD